MKKATQNHTSTAPKFEIHADSLGTFLDIAARRIHEWAQNGQLEPCHIHTLRHQCNGLLMNMGSVCELLGMEHIDYVQSDNLQTVTAALMMAGRSMQETAAIYDSLQMAETRNERQRQEQANKADDWPAC